MTIGISLYQVTNKGEIIDFYGFENKDINILEKYFQDKLLNLVTSETDYEQTLEKMIGKSSDDFKFFMSSSETGIYYIRKDCDKNNIEEILDNSENYINYNGKTINKLVYLKGIKAKNLYYMDFYLSSKLALEINSGYLSDIVCAIEDLNKLYSIIDDEYKLEFKENIIKKFKEGKTFILIS